MDEASWLINNGQLSNSIEGGYFSGNWVYGSGGWFTGLLAYYTTSNGSSGTRGSTYLAANSPILMDVVSGGHVTVGPTTFSFSYTVTNGTNFGQGEVLESTNTWMGNGSGNGFTGYWSPNGSSWYTWGSQTACANSPYWDILQSQPSDYRNGGY